MLSVIEVPLVSLEAAGGHVLAVCPRRILCLKRTGIDLRLPVLLILLLRMHTEERMSI